MKSLRSSLAIVSGLLCIAITIVWVRSYFDSETFCRMEGNRVWAMDSFGGEVSFWRGRIQPNQPPHYGHEHWERGRAITSIQQPVVNPAGDDLWFAGFGYTTQRRFPLTYLSLPYGTIVDGNGVTHQIESPMHITNPKGLVIPFWFLAIATAISPGIALRRAWLASRRARVGMCAHCGYDLRASADRCPECGMPMITPRTPTPTPSAERERRTLS